MGEPYTVRTRGYGLPDYAAPKPVGSVSVGPVYTSTDMAELAVRLGSPVTFDRRGNVIWFDDFENGLNKWLINTAGDSVVSWANASRNGAFSSKLLTGPAGIAATAGIETLLPFPVLGKLGLEFSFTFDDHVNNIRFTFDLYDGAYVHRPEITYYPNTNLFTYRDIDGMAREISTHVNLSGSFDTIKLVVDYSQSEFVRMIVNNITLDLLGIKYQKAALESPALLNPAFLVVNTVPNPATVYIDDVIITQNEPDNI